MKFEYLRALLLLATPAFLHADWKEDVGFYRLQQTFTSGVPTGVAAGVTQTEASDEFGNFYLPDNPVAPSHPEFLAKTLTNKSTGSGVSGHAAPVGVSFYGNTGSLIPATTIVDAYNANGWIGSDFLKSGSGEDPVPELRRVQNHSWIAVYDRSKNTETEVTQTVAHINFRLDYAINRDGFISVAGANNGFSTTLPDLLVQGYNSISVGLTNGNHSAGLTTHDGTGRMKPDIVSFDGLTSFATPQVASAAGLISEMLRNTYSSDLVTADYPRLTKALLLAGATKDHLSSWSRANTAKPYDAVYGAGALNVLLAYRILEAGRQIASATATSPETGWDKSTASQLTSRRYFFEIPPGTTLSRFSAAITWHRTNSATLPDLDLNLYSATGTTLGTVLDASVSTVDNVEHIYQAALTSGRYALVVSSSAFTTTEFSIAWRTSPTVNVTATTPMAREIDGTSALFTITRTGSTTSPLLVPLTWGGTAVSGTHYTTPPTSVLIPAGASSATVAITPISDDLAQGNRSVTVSVATDYSLSAGASASATATIEDKPYDAWRFTHFNAQELADETITGPNADPDADGIPNLIEYALGGLPKSVDASTRSPAVGINSGHLTLTYTHPTSLNDLAYVVQWSPDLVSWTTGPGVTELVESTAHDDNTTTRVTRAIEPLDLTPRQFLRLRISRPPNP